MEELTLREIQLGELEILKQFKRICEEQNLRYYLFYGTLLGAVRHGGFIPWDDDVDVAMPRDDYEKFIAYCKENAENLKPLELLHYSTNSEFIYPIARLNDTRYTTVYKNVDDYGLGLFIDIYPFDGCGNSEEEALINIKRTCLLEHLIASAGTNHFEKSKKGGLFNNIKKAIGYGFSHIIGARTLCKIMDEKIKRSEYGKRYVSCLIWDGSEEKIFPQELFTKITEKKFEDTFFAVPEMYTELLSILYGDFLQLPPEEMRIGHHEYRVFNK